MSKTYETMRMDGYFSVCLFYIWEVIKISKNKTKINEEIRENELRVIDENGTMVGIISRNEALSLADERGLDLVNVSPNANPPVCKLLDYGKYRYEQQKREKEAKKKQVSIQVKEIRLSVSIEEHDLNVKAKTATKFLKGGNKVKVSLRFRGRERNHVPQAQEVMKNFAEIISEYGEIEKNPKMEGRSLIMFISPKTDK